MRSYYAHLETAMGSPLAAIPPKPTFRSSAIFPMLQMPGISSRILFMGYWILKRNIREIAAVITLRNTAGNVLFRDHMLVQEPKTYRVELSEQLAKSGLAPNANFTGSMEIEFFSTQNLVFPFPAVVINYYGPEFSTVVHTAQRIYNDFDDMNRNSQSEVPESGFNIYAEDDREPFIGLINGATAVPDCKIYMQFFNEEKRSLSQEINVGILAPYETKIIFPAQLVDLKSFLKGKVGAAKIHFHVNWIFPRLIVGNIQHSLPAVTITHTYYDCSSAVSDADYWRPNEPEWHPASLMIPVVLKDTHFTNIYFYPIYSPSTFAIDVEIYNSSGSLLGKKENAVCVDTKKATIHSIHFKELCSELQVSDQSNLAARLIARNTEGSRLPARIKLALDIGYDAGKIPCNICTNLQPFNPQLATKPKSFKWLPLLADQPEASVWIMNSSSAIDFRLNAEVEINFYREKDQSTISRKVTVPPHGFIEIQLSKDQEIKDFLAGSIGWLTASTTNPFTTTYYFAENPSGVVGGDHGF